VVAVADQLHGRALLLDERRQDRGIAVIERRHRVEGVRERAESGADREHAVAILRRGVARGAHDPLFVEEADDVACVLDLRCDRDHHERAARSCDHLFRARNARSDDPIAAMDAPVFRIDERSFEMDAQALGADDLVAFEQGVRGLRDLAGRVQHRFPGRGHDRRDEARRALRGVGLRREFDRVALIAIEQDVAGAVRVDVDHPGGDRRPGGQREIAWAIPREDLRNAARVDREAAETERSVAER
jgi:hypothetical protein